MALLNFGKHEISFLKQEIENLKQQLSDLTIRYGSLEFDYQRLKEECQKLKEEYQGLKEENETLKNEKIGLNTETWQENHEENAKELKYRMKNFYPSRNGLKPAEILMLYYAHNFHNGTNNFQSFWYYEYEIKNPQEILNLLLEKNFIYVTSAKENLKNLTIIQLKEILKELNLKLSGKKTELISRIIENAKNEYLENKITVRNFELTDLGKQELKENEYIPYFHKVKFKYAIDMLWMNQKLHEYPNMKYRDIMWGEFNKRRTVAMDRIKIGDYSGYIREGSRMCDFLLEENKYEQALFLLSEATYYDVNIYSESYFANRAVNEYTFSVEMSIFNIERFEIIKEKMNFSDDDFFKKLNFTFSKFYVQNPIISGIDMAGIILTFINCETDILDNFFTDLQKELQEQHKKITYS